MRGYALSRRLTTDPRTACWSRISWGWEVRRRRCTLRMNSAVRRPSKGMLHEDTVFSCSSSKDDAEDSRIHDIPHSRARLEVVVELGEKRSCVLVLADLKELYAQLERAGEQRSKSRMWTRARAAALRCSHAI